MLKQDLTARVAYVAGQSEAAIRNVCDAIRAVTILALSKGESVMLFGLGRLSVARRGATQASNFVSGAPVTVPPRNVAKWKPSGAVNAAINKVLP